MPITPLPIAGGNYESDSLPLSAQECVNWYPNIPQTASLSAESLFGTPGSTQLATTGEQQQNNLGAHAMDGVPYFVNGTNLYRLNRTTDGNGVETFDTEDLGALGFVGNPVRVSMADNGSQLMVLIPGGKGWIFTTDPDALTEITDGDFRASGDPQFCAYIDGFFVLTTDSKKFIVSSINDGLSYNALDFGTAEADPDDIVAPIVYKNQLFIMGGQTAEAFQNVGGADFPFQRTGLFLDKGMFAPLSGVNASDTFLFIGGGVNESPAIWGLSGNSVQKVSTTAIDSILQELTDAQLSQVFAWSYAQKGAYFIGFALPSTTLVFDTISQRWHERKSQIADIRGNINTVRSRINSMVSAYGRVLVGDSQDGRIGELSPDVYTEYGNNIIRVVASRPFQNNMQPFTLPSLELTVESGVGNEAAPNPQMRMAYSHDGKTYTDDKSRPLGKVGEFSRRAIWRRIGRVPRFVVLRFTLSDPVKPVIIQLTANIL